METIDPETFATTLLREMARASELGADGLHVQVTVPSDAAFEWIDGQGGEHAVHLPTMLKLTPMHMLGQPHEDGGPAAVFRIAGTGHVPPRSVVDQLAEALYRESIRWGRVRHARPWAPSVDELPPLPPGLDDLVEQAIFRDAD